MPSGSWDLPSLDHVETGFGIVDLPAPPGPLWHPTAIIGEGPEHRDYQLRPETWKGCDVDESARLSSFVTVHQGFDRTTVVGARSMIMTKAHIGHDAIVGEDCEIAALAVIGGHCTVGNRVRIGVGAILRTGISVGDDAQVGAGAVVTRSIPAGEVWAGVPARRLDS